MRIAGINITNNRNFNGLWGKTYLKTDVDCVLGVPMRREEKYYFPFSDEDEESVNNILKSRRKAEFVNNYSRYIYYDCLLGEKLPLNQQQYDAYMRVNNFRTDRDLRDRDKWLEQVHSIVRDKYMSEEYGRSQKPAYNPGIEERLVNTYI